MCLTIPGKVEKIENNGKIIVNYSGEKRQADISIVNVEKGDWVIVNNKIIIDKLSDKKAKRFLELVK
jgi:hydrogenase assembly chaperone HypC/HupF